MTPRTPTLLARAAVGENTDPSRGQGTGVEGLRPGDALLTLDSASDGPITVGSSQLQRADSEVAFLRRTSAMQFIISVIAPAARCSHL